MPFSVDPVSTAEVTAPSTAPVASSVRIPEPAPDGGAGFGAALTGALEDLQAMQSTANELSIRAVTGDLTDIHQATLAATRAQVTLELVAAVRNKGVAAFNEIMRMQA